MIVGTGVRPHGVLTDMNRVWEGADNVSWRHGRILCGQRF